MDYKIGSTSLTTYAIIANDEQGPADLAGGDVSIPYQSGLTAGSRTLKGRELAIYLTVSGSSIGDYHERVQALTALCLNVDAEFKPQPFVLTRIQLVGAGTQTCTINARFSGGLRMVRDDSPMAGRTTLLLTLLDAWWLDGASAKVYA